jgi:signal transduction histidine kinase
MSLAVHELRTPASVVGGYLRMLLRDAEPGLADRQRRMVEEAEKSLAHMVLLVGQMSELARLQDGTAAVVEGPVDLFQLLGDVAADVHDAEDRNVRLRVDGPVSGAPLRGDAQRLRAALAALLRAVLREQPAGTIVVADRRRARNGHSLALVVIARAGDLERAAVAAPTPAFDEWRGGLGLALPIARFVVERHGGHVWSPLAGDADAAARGAIVVSVPIQE